MKTPTHLHHRGSKIQLYFQNSYWYIGGSEICFGTCRDQKMTPVKIEKAWTANSNYMKVPSHPIPSSVPIKFIKSILKVQSFSFKFDSPTTTLAEEDFRIWALHAKVKFVSRKVSKYVRNSAFDKIVFIVLKGPCHVWKTFHIL